MTAGSRPAQDRRDRLPLALLAFALAQTLFLLVPPFLKGPVGPPAGFTLQEAADLATPIAVLPLAWLVVGIAGSLDRRRLAVLLVITIAWVQGHSMHLAANAMGDAVAPDAEAAYLATPVGDLGHWIDEVLSHWVWHGAMVALGLFMLAAGRSGGSAPRGSVLGVVLLAGLAYGATFFMVTVEGTTPLLGLPASLVTLAWSVADARRSGGGRPIAVFSLTWSAVALLAYAAWAAINGGRLPEFSAVGLFG